ncbi:hypothetical protein B0H63DRAFT_474336 [Podospora didyma]|uniref:Uncharacterized protein n=1 Tax=Podospora didyma TaxID=330526 RepID=A0AAE0NR99_9PEZI|nr:hypothetical protein B0H63DRAFT_474336 [Podospora didyma]
MSHGRLVGQVSLRSRGIACGPLLLTLVRLRCVANVSAVRDAASCSTTRHFCMHTEIRPLQFQSKTANREYLSLLQQQRQLSLTSVIPILCLVASLCQPTVSGIVKRSPASQRLDFRACR